MSPWLSDLFLRSQSDDRLVALAAAGHPRAFTTIVERYRRALFGYARRFGHDRAEDLVQQTFLCAFSALQSGAEVRHLRGWLYQILRNLAVRAGTSALPEAELESCDAVTESAEHAAERRLLATEALAAMSRLPERQHDALIQTAIHGRTRTEVADVMGVSEGAVRQLVHRARETLRTAVTAVTPLPLARWFASVSGSAGNALPELVAGAGAVPAAGFALKLGAVMATGVVATGLVSAGPGHHRSSPSRVPDLGAQVTFRTDGSVLRPVISSRDARGQSGRGSGHTATASAGQDPGRTGHGPAAGAGRRPPAVGSTSGDGGQAGEPTLFDDRGTGESRGEPGPGSSAGGSSRGSGGGSDGGRGSSGPGDGGSSGPGSGSSDGGSGSRGDSGTQPTSTLTSDSGSGGSDGGSGGSGGGSDGGGSSSSNLPGSSDGGSSVGGAGSSGG